MNFMCTSFGGERDSRAQNVGPVTCNLVRGTNCGKKKGTGFSVRLRSVFYYVSNTLLASKY